MNRIKNLFRDKPYDICSIFITAGYPNLNDTTDKVLELEAQGVDLVEIGMPFSDPLADGETIQHSSKIALDNGMNIALLFEQIKEIRKQSEIPIALMGYINPVLSFGLDKFLKTCKEVGIDALIIPDISLEEYELQFQNKFEEHGIPLVFLVTPRTSLERVMKIKEHSKAFIYYVSSSSTTGKTGEYSEEQIANFKQFNELKLGVPVLMGFGIHNKKTFDTACKYFNGGIIGSAYLRSLSQEQSAESFLREIV